MESRIRNTVVETPSFVKHAAALWSESEVDTLKDYVAMHPMAGDEIPGTGGLRKLRWSRAGMGKRGGARVIYYFYDETAPVYLLYAYTKASQEDLTTDERKAVVTFVQLLKEEIRKRKRMR